MPASTVKRVTAADVARSLGLSRATVGFVLNDTPGQTIPEATRERVLAEAKRLGYRANTAARALASGRSRIILLVLPDWPLDYSMRTHLDEASLALDEAGYSLVTTTPHPGGQAQPLWETLRPGCRDRDDSIQRGSTRADPRERSRARHPLGAGRRPGARWATSGTSMARDFRSSICSRVEGRVWRSPRLPIRGSATWSRSDASWPHALSSRAPAAASSPIARSARGMLRSCSPSGSRRASTASSRTTTMSPPSCSARRFAPASACRRISRSSGTTTPRSRICSFRRCPACASTRRGSAATSQRWHSAPRLARNRHSAGPETEARLVERETT